MKKIKKWFKDLYARYKLRKKIKELREKDPFIYKQMTEFSDGIFNVIKRMLTANSLTLAIAYTLGHILIAMSVVTLLTGASLWEAGAVALIEPTINGVWFYVLHSIWKKYKGYK